jgi:diguanylate cyclase (GGDEF)-like protein/PAS domain S-box-containing protein
MLGPSDPFPEARSTKIVKTDDVIGEGWAVLDALELPVAVLNSAGDIVAVNAAWQDCVSGSGGVADMIGVGVGANYLEVCQSGLPHRYGCAATGGIAGVLDGSLPEFVKEYPCLTTDENRWFRMMVRPLRQSDGDGAVITHADVSDKHHTEARILRTQRHFTQRAESFTTLFHATAEAMVIHDGTTFVAVNQAYADMLGLEPDQVTGRPLLDFVAPASHMLMAEQVQQRPEIPYDLVAQRADGSTFLVELLGRQIQFEGRSLRLLTVRDVTRQRAEQEALRASEARQALLLHLAETQRETRDPDHMLAMASEALGRHLETHRVGFFEMVDDATMLRTACWTDGILPPLSGPVSTVGPGSGFASAVRAGHSLRIADLKCDPRTAETTDLKHGARAGIGVPLVRGDQWRAGLFVGHASIRAWTEEEVELVRDVAEQTWDAVERGRAESALRTSEARFRAIVQESSDIVVVFNATGGVRYASPALERVLGHPVEAYADSLRLDLVHRDDRDAVVRAWTSVLDTPEVGARAMYRTLNADGAWVWLDANVTNLLHLPEIEGIVLHARDVTEQKRLELELRHLALHDPLTGLPNRTLLADRMDQALRQAVHDGKRVGLLFLDLDYFKQVNDAFGHEAGDQLLHGVARRLQSIAGVGETVARLGGDEFVVLLPMMPDALHAMTRAEQVQAAMGSPFSSHGREVTIGLTIGVAVSEPGLLKAEALLRDGDAALYRAKRTGRGHYLVHESTMSGNAMRRWRLKTDVGKAAARGELMMHYQPIVALTTGIVTAMEALLRWQHPVYGMVPPDEFIPLAEEAGQIVALGRWGLTQVCETLRQWGVDAPSIAFNVSATQFSDPGLVQNIAAEIARTSIEPGKLRLEITEQITIEDVAGTVSTLTELRELGVGVSIDDFGSGYSSLRYLRELPVSGVKLDRSFMRGLESDPGAQAMVMGIVSLAHTIGLSVTAEGIETAGQLALMHAIDCDFGQGFYLALPAPILAGDPIRRIDVPPNLP